MVARGDEEMVEVERQKKYDEKVRVEGKLVEVGESIEEAKVDGLKDVVKELKKEERDIKTSLRAVEVALEALELFGADGMQAEELLVEAKRERSQLKAQLKRVRRKKGQVGVQRTQLVEADSRKRSGASIDMRKIVPIVQKRAEVEDSADEESSGTAVVASDTDSVVEDVEEPSGTVVVASDTDSVVEDVAAPFVVRKRSHTRRRKMRVIRRFRRGKVTRKLSAWFLKKVMEYRERRARDAELAEV